MAEISEVRDAWSDPPDAHSRTTILECNGVSKRFGGFHALAEIDIAVAEGEILGIIGPNGAGKTTLFNLIAGVFRPSSGKIAFRHRDVTRMSPHRRTRLGIGRTFQLIEPFTSMTIADNVATAAMATGLRRDAAEALAHDLVERVGLASIASGVGLDINAVEGKRMEVARALATRPALLLLDEIFAGLNAEEVDEMLTLVSQLRGDGITVLVIEHNVRAIRAIADRVVALDAGAVVCVGTPDAVFADPNVLESYFGHRGDA